MSDLLINWLNDEVQLSRRITNFEEDFHNGYLFGELLNKFSQQLNFSDFVDKYKTLYVGMINTPGSGILPSSMIPLKPSGWALTPISP